MTLDNVTLSVLTAFVVNVCGVVFILETTLRRPNAAASVWALGFLAAMATTLAYLVWAQTPAAWWAVAAGNAAFVTGTGCMWLGCRRYNRRRMTWSSLAVAVGAVGAAAAVIGEGPEGGDWAGALWMFLALLVFAAAGAIECVRGSLGREPLAWGLAAVLGLQALFYVSRTTAFLTSGAESSLFIRWFGTQTASFLSVGLTIVAVVVTSVLTSDRAPRAGSDRAPGFATSVAGVTTTADFARSLAELCERAAARSELVAVIAVRIEGLEQFATAFGAEHTEAIAVTMRAGVRRHAPSAALVGEDDDEGLLAAIVSTSAPDARRRAAAVYRGVFDELSQLSGAVIPVIGVGVALSESTGYHPDDLVSVARDAAVRAAGTIETTVVVGDEDERDQAAVSR